MTTRAEAIEAALTTARWQIEIALRSAGEEAAVIGGVLGPIDAALVLPPDSEPTGPVAELVKEARERVRTYGVDNPLTVNDHKLIKRLANALEATMKAEPFVYIAQQTKDDIAFGWIDDGDPHGLSRAKNDHFIVPLYLDPPSAEPKPTPVVGAGIELETTAEEIAQLMSQADGLKSAGEFGAPLRRMFWIATDFLPRLLRDVAKLQSELAEGEASFDLRWKADMRAIKAWQEAHPGNDLVWPDHADLCVWLMDGIARIRPLADEAGTMRAALKDVRGWIEPLVKTHTAVAEAVRRIDRALAPAPSPETKPSELSG